MEPIEPIKLSPLDQEFIEYQKEYQKLIRDHIFSSLMIPAKYFLPDKTIGSMGYKRIFNKNPAAFETVPPDTGELPKD